MKAGLCLLVCCLLGLGAAGAVATGGVDAAALLSAPLPPPPRRTPIAQLQQATHAAEEHALLESQTEAHAAVDVSAVAAAEANLAVDDSLLASAAVEDTVTAAGQMSAEEQALVERMFTVPKTRIPVAKAVPIQYMAPPTTEKLRPAGRYPWPEKLQNALTTVEEAAKSRIDQIRRQNKWSTAAETLVTQLNAKKSKVLTHVAQLTKEIKKLLGKKKQIQNKQLQDKLVERLEKTHQNLKQVRVQTHNIRKNQAAMIHQKEELAHALEGIRRSLATLKGFKRQRRFPDRGTGKRMKEELSQFDPELSHEAEAEEVRALANPGMIFAEQDAEAEEMQPEEEY